MAFVSLSNNSPGAPELKAVNGSLCAVLDWALVQAGWAIEYTNGANARVYRPPLGNRFRLHVNHDSAVSTSANMATIRGCENATSATDLIDPFPTVAQKANNYSTVLIGTGATVAREYHVIAHDTFMLMAISGIQANTSGWDIMFFGDLVPTNAADNYATAILIGDSAATSASSSRAMSSVLYGGPSFTGKVFFARSIDGTVKSTGGALSGTATSSGASNLCAIGNTPAMRAGFLARIVREKLAASCTGSSTTAVNTALCVVRRGWVPWLWSPLHYNVGSVTTDDTFTDATYAAGATFRPVLASTSVAAILELTNTWSAPSG